MPNEPEPNNPTLQRIDVDKGRRRFLNYLPIAIFASIAGTITAAAYRVLKPVAGAPLESKWLDALPMANVKGDKPMMCTIITERSDGWSTALEEQQVIILPAHNRQALSIACPHEGCNVMWRDETNDFFCPCHDSSFAPDGARVSGPSPRGLDPIPSREKNGMLQVQYQTFVNNTVERVPRA